MKVLLDHQLPFHLAHGGLQTQIEQTKQSLNDVGIDVEFLRWWDQSQTADIIHFFGRPNAAYIDLAQAKGIRIVMAELLTGAGSRTPAQLAAQKLLIWFFRRLLPSSFIARMSWDSYSKADAIVALTPHEAGLMRSLFGAPASRVHVIPNGVETAFLESEPAERGPWLVCTATITERKRVFELAQAAVAAMTPVWIIGRPYDDQDAYGRAFVDFSRQNARYIRYEGPINDRKVLARIYREARGFVLLSTMESLSLSALEAAACGCPLLLSNLPWATTTFQQSVQFVGKGNEVAALKKFYAEAPTLPAPRRPESWLDVAGQLQSLYSRLLNTSP
jgi:glycosyltransferase involved in cell wall biosynthesis